MKTKRLFVFFLLIFASDIYGQNEFAAPAFYSQFKNICVDAQNNFTTYKGDKRKSESEGVAIEYNLKVMLPLADSGKIVIPHTGRSYAIYYFEPSKIRLKIDQRATNLRDAMATVFEKLLYTKTETFLVNDHPLTNWYYFTDASETRPLLAAFKVSIYYQDGLYYLSLEIKGLEAEL